MKSKILALLLITPFAAIVLAQLSSPEAVKSPSPGFELVFFRAKEDGKVSLAAVEAKAREILIKKYSDFPKDMLLGSIHVDYKRSKPIFSIYFSYGLGKRCWMIDLDLEWNVHRIHSGMAEG